MLGAINPYVWVIIGIASLIVAAAIVIYKLKKCFHTSRLKDMKFIYDSDGALLAEVECY